MKSSTRSWFGIVYAKQFIQINKYIYIYICVYCYKYVKVVCVKITYNNIIFVYKNLYKLTNIKSYLFIKLFYKNSKIRYFKRT
jgi:hypothetical protein